MRKFHALNRILMLLFVCTLGYQTALAQLLPYKNPALSFDERAKDLLSRMTVEEKISQMMNVSPSIERLGIQPYDWWNEALHGVARAGAATVFPQAIALAATFDDQAVHETFTIVSDEARAKHHDAVKRGDFRRYTGLTFWTPNINIFRDPRWGRGMETYGEDPYLTGRMGVAVVKGLQGDGTSKYDKTHACAKHYAVHSGPEWNRHSYDAKNISNRDLLETYLPAFQELVQEADVKEVMCAYNRLEGEPCCGSSNLLITILREKWGFDGVVTSDCGAISDFWMKGRHETSPDRATASATAVINGTDVECGNNFKSLTEAYKAGQINEAQIDQAVFRLLKARFELGMFDDPGQVSWSKIPMSVVESAPHKAKALEMARKSMVLLSNKNNALPLSKNLKKVAVLGPNANDSVMLWANYNGIPTQSVTILEGITQKLPQAQVVYEKGCELVIDRVFHSLFKDCRADGKAGFKATYYNGRAPEGTPITTVQVASPFNFNTGGNTVFAPGVPLNDFSARYEATFTPSVSADVAFRIGGDDGYRLLINGEEVAGDWGDHGLSSKEHIMKAEAGKSYKIEIQYYNGGQGGVLTFDLGTVVETDYESIARKVSDADVIIFAGGISSKLEGEEMRVDLPGFRGGDRTDIELPAVQRNLLKALKSTGKPVIFVLCAGSAMAVNQENEALDAILLAWYPGQEGGTAVADVLFGDYNPAGRLPLTFYKSVTQIPDFEDYHMNKGRTYRYFQGDPLYPFGYGLSYTTFDYDNARAGKTTLNAGDPIDLDILIKNAGKRDGEEVVQVYVRNLQDPNGPVKSLRAFQRVHIPSGKTATVKIGLTAKSFEFYDEATGTLKVKPGQYELLYGGSSDAKELKSMMITLK